MWKVIGIYGVIVNLVTFFLFALDKYKARKRKWRISESVLMTMAFLGGSLGAMAGMSVFHHKTRHRKFTVWVPVFLLFHALLLLYGYVFVF